MAMKYRLKFGSHTRYEDGRRVTLQPGDIFEPSEVELQAFGDKLEHVHMIESPAAGNELEELRERAKDLGVENTNKMGKDRLLKKIALKEEEQEQQFDKDGDEQ